MSYQEWCERYGFCPVCGGNLEHPVVKAQHEQGKHLTTKDAVLPLCISKVGG